MSPKLLLVVDPAVASSNLERMLHFRYDVATVRDAHEALARVHAEGPFGVVLVEHSDARDGVALLRELRSADPLFVGLLAADVAKLDGVESASDASPAFRLLTRPYSFQGLIEAIEEALVRHRASNSAEYAADELILAMDRIDTTETAPAKQAAGLSCLHKLAKGLITARTIQEIADLAAYAAHEALIGRGVHVQVWDDHGDRPAIEASAGPEMSSQIFLEPILGHRGPIGEIAVDGTGNGHERLDEPERSLLASIAYTTAVAASSALRRREDDRAHHDTLMAIARLLGRRDNETSKHLKRVEAYSRLIAEGLRADGHEEGTITETFVDDLVAATPLYDIGEAGIPDSILLKPQKLKPEEWEILKTHPEIGALALSSVIQENGTNGFLTLARDLAYCHHEHWDGGGYPRGLKGAQIPLAARILALADVYDALTTVRPHKTAWEHADAIEWIEGQSGKHFDPHVVASFVRRAEEVDRIRLKLADSLQEIQSKNPEIFGSPLA